MDSSSLLFSKNQIDFPHFPLHKFDTKKFDCPQCSKQFSTKGNMKNHFQTIHLKNKPYKCLIQGCNKSYSSNSRLQLHIKSHSDNRPFICNICQKAFRAKINLKTHIEFHSNLRPFICDLCGKQYKTKGHLKDHFNSVHQNSRDYQCPVCKNAFNRKSTLKAHMKIHTGEKNFICSFPGCNKSFNKKGNLKYHYNRHLLKNAKQHELNLNLIEDKTKESSLNNSYQMTPSSSSVKKYNQKNDYKSSEENNSTIMETTSTSPRLNQPSKGNSLNLNDSYLNEYNQGILNYNLYYNPSFIKVNKTNSDEYSSNDSYNNKKEMITNENSKENNENNNNNNEQRNDVFHLNFENFGLQNGEDQQSDDLLEFGFECSTSPA